MLGQVTWPQIHNPPYKIAKRLSVNASSDKSKVTPDGDSDLSKNKRPVARNDMIKTESNNPVVVKVLDNDIDPDGDKLKIVSVGSHTENRGVLSINNNGTITYSPATGLAGADAFSYTITDGKGKSDTARVTIIVKAIADIKQDRTEITSTTEREAGEQENRSEKNQPNNNDTSRS